VIAFLCWPSVPLGEGIYAAGNLRFAKQLAKLFGPLFSEGYAPQPEPQGRETITMDESLSAAGWHGHEWAEPKARLVRVATGYSVVQRHCTQCHRDFIVTPSGERKGVFVSIVSFFLLDDEVTDRWVNLTCPGRRPPSDDDDRKRRVAELMVSYISESAMTLQPRHRRPERRPLFVENAATERMKDRGERN
jgi:hypothetical protein